MVPHLSIRPGLCLHPSRLPGWDAGRIIRGALHLSERTPHILVRAPSLPNQRAYESLQGRAGWPHSTPRRCHAVPGRSLVPVRRQGSPNEPRYHSALAGRGDHCVNRTRVRKYSANRFYMRSLSLI